MKNEKFLLAKAWDNRIGLAIAIEVLKNLQKEQHPNIVYGVGTVQEEVGLRGAKTASFNQILVLPLTLVSQEIHQALQTKKQ
ncbi:Putative aminopeptidase ysdC [Listeria monocytogenes]|nr:Putative aminopeptidase ysdC [Listeria monocytogenes]